MGSRTATYVSRTLWWVPCCQEHMTFIGPQALYDTPFRLLMSRLFPIKNQSLELDHRPVLWNILQVFRKHITNWRWEGLYFRSLWTFFIYISDTLFRINNGKNAFSSTNGAAVCNLDLVIWYWGRRSIHSSKQITTPMNNINALTLILPTRLMMTSCRNV